MYKHYIKSISIEGFRGINNENNPLELDFNVNGLTSIFSPNGMGKSSIFDALSFCLNDELKCLKPILPENRDYKSIKNIFHNGDGLISIVLQDEKSKENTIKFKILDDGSKEITSTNNKTITDLLDNIKDIHNFLDYNAFADIIYSDQKNAGRTFLRLIGYESFSEIQDEITSLTYNLNRDYNIQGKKDDLNSNNEKISTLKEIILEKIKNVGLKNKKINHKIISKSALKSISKIANVKEVSFFDIDFEKLIDSLSKKNDEFSKHKEDLIKSIQEKEKLSGFLKKIKLFSEPKYNKIKRRLNNAYDVLENEIDKYIGELYEKAINTYNEFPGLDKNRCVLCNTSDLGNSKFSFYQQLETKINKYNRFKEKYNEFRALLISLIELSELGTLEEILSSKKPIQNKKFTVFYHNPSIITIKQFEENNYYNTVNHYEQLLSELVEKENQTIEELKSSIPEELHTIITKLTHYQTIQDSLNQIIELEKLNSSIKLYIKYVERWIQFITTVRDKFTTESNALVKGISEDISNDTQAFFQEIMSSPEIIPKIEKKDAGQKILMKLEKFYSAEDKKAATLLSESNRNALCLSIYFACALKKSNSAFLVLDDITSSFDSGHQRNLLMLLKNRISKIYNKKGKQIIVLTHDGELEKSLKAYSTEIPQKWTHYILAKESNIRVDKNQISLNDISTILKAKAANSENIGNEIRKYFERIILEIHKNLKIPMGYELANNRDIRMLHDLIVNLRNMLKLYRSASGIQVINTLPSDSDFVDILTTEKDVANIISHYESDSSSSYSPSFIVGIINKIESFNQKFQYNCACPEVNGGMTYYARINSKKSKKCKCQI